MATQGDATGRVADELLRGTPERLVRGAQQRQACLQQAPLGSGSLTGFRVLGHIQVCAKKGFGVRVLTLTPNAQFDP